MDITKELEKRIYEIEKVFPEYLPKEEGYAATLMEAMNYTILAGGKRIRPILMLETSRLFGGDDKTVYPFAVGLEMIHNYSLVHDDLEAMDNDDMRRGKLTTHKKYGEAIGVLAGDGLLNFSYEVMLSAIQIDSPMMKRQLLATQMIAQKAGIQGMIGGQTVDVLAEKQSEKVTADKLEYIHHKKTGALWEASMMAGAVLAGATQKEISLVEQIASDIGLAFQIQDDILDEESTFEELGKPIGSDVENGKVTYVTFEGLQKAHEDVESLSKRAMIQLDNLPGDKEFLRELFGYMVYRKK